jgi:hypothetical protein
MACLGEEPGWFGQISRLAASVTRRGAREEADCKAAPIDGTHWKSFDLADVMEAGLATEVTTSFTTAPPLGWGASRLVVERSIDRMQHLLKGEDGEPLLLAVCDEQDNSRISFYVPTGGDPPLALGPAFTLAAEDDDCSSWTLTTDRCECCEFLPAPRGCCSGAGRRACRRELARIYHTREDFGQCSMISMEVELPELRPDNSPSLWCSSSSGAEGKPRLRLESRRPSWNDRLKSLTLDFRGRCSKASIQNVQLDLVTGEEFDDDPPKKGEPEFLFGKTGLSTFVLDYRHPLGTAQAFAIALTTNQWR